MTIPSSDPTSDSGDAGARAPEPVAVAPAARASASGHRGRRLALHFLAVLLAASALAAVVSGPPAALSAALGVALAGVNLLLMQKITRAMVAGSDGGGGNASGGNAAWGLALPFKLVTLVGVAYVLVSSGVAQPVPLAMGFALLPLTGVFLPRPITVPALDPRPRARPTASQPRRRHEPTPSRQGEPTA